MDYKTKRRLIVAIIIIALVVIFLPIPFTHHKQPITSTFKHIPNAPQVKKPNILAGKSSQSIVEHFKSQAGVMPETPLPANVNTQAKTIAVTAPVNKAKVSPTTTSTTHQQVSQAVHPAKQLPQALVTQQPKSVSQKPVPHSIPQHTQQLKATPPVVTMKMNKHVHHQHSHKKVHHSDAIDTSPVVSSFATGKKGAIVVHQDALGTLPEIDIRKLDANSSNIAGSKERVAIAKKEAVAWVIQLASFATLDQARQLLVKLRENGYVAFMQPATIHGKTKHRVYVGPFTREQQAEGILHVIDKKLKMHGYIHHFKPTVMIP